MCPSIGAIPSQNPFLGLDNSTPVGAPKGEKTQAPGKLDKALAKESVTLSRSESGNSGAGFSKVSASLTKPSKLPSDGGTISASTQRLVDMAIAETKDGPAASFLAKVMLKNAGEQRDQAMRDMMAARQNAYSLSLSAADDLRKSGADLQSGAQSSLGLNLAGSILHFGGTSAHKAEKSTSTAAKAEKASEVAAKAEQPSKATIMGSGFQSAGQYASTHADSQSKSAEADQKTDEASAQQAEMVADRKKDTLDKIEELTKQVIDFLHNMQEANNDMMAAITRA